MVSKKLKFIYCLSIFIISYIFFNIYSAKNITQQLATINPHVANTSINCFHLSGKEETLVDITDIKVRNDKSIFFHETSCRSYANKKIAILGRQACAIESAARQNPKFDIYLTFSSPGLIINDETQSGRFLKQLQRYANVKIVYLNFERYLRNTIIEDIYVKGKLAESSFVVSHASDILRFLTLHKYGGIYLDLDVIVLKSLEKLKLNFAALESDDTVGSAILGFSRSENGHEYTKRCLDDLHRNFDPLNFIQNGPYVITRFARELCNRTDLVNVTVCEDFTLHESATFYPVGWPNWSWMFDSSEVPRVNDLIDEAYTIHVWNKLSNDAKKNVRSNIPLHEIARKYCPNVFKECYEFF